MPTFLYVCCLRDVIWAFAFCTMRKVSTSDRQQASLQQVSLKMAREDKRRLAM